jgi:hypothetical protein
MTWRMAIAAAIIGCAAARAAGADDLRTGERFVVFPFEGVNVPPSSARASTEVLVSLLRSRGLEIADLEEPAAAGGGPEALPTPPTTVDKGEIARAHGCSGYIDGKLVRLGALIRVSVNERDLDGRVRESREAEARNDDDLVGVLERISAALADGGSVDGTLTLDNATVVETQRKTNTYRMEKNFGLVIGGTFGVGDTMDSGMLLAFDGRLETGDLLVVLNAGIVVATPDEYDDFLESAHVERDYGSSGDTAGASADEGAPGFQFWLGFDFAYYLTHTPIAPYLGAGVGMFVGGRVHLRDRVDTDHDGFEDGTRYSDSEVGLDVHPTIGVELLRHTSIRVHVEVRYACDFAERGRFGHGPMVLAGIDF